MMMLQIRTNGWTHPDPWTATTDVIAPLTGGLLGMLLLPAAVVWALRHFIDLPAGGKFICEFLAKFQCIP